MDEQNSLTRHIETQKLVSTLSSVQLTLMKKNQIQQMQKEGNQNIHQLGHSVRIRVPNYDVGRLSSALSRPKTQRNKAVFSYASKKLHNIPFPVFNY